MLSGRSMRSLSGRAHRTEFGVPFPESIGPERSERAKRPEREAFHADRPDSEPPRAARGERPVVHLNQ
jgi:hypothetical protein